MSRRFKVRRAYNGRSLLNLGCGLKAHREWVNVDFSPYAFLTKHPRFARTLKLLRVLSERRYNNVARVEFDIIKWDLRTGIPFDDDVFDVVYHSHFLEHLPRKGASLLMAECHRVLKPGGVVRVVLPDLELIIKRYMQSCRCLENGTAGELEAHSRVVEELFEQMVRDEGAGTSDQARTVRSLERIVRGKARDIGEAHSWMYDRYTLRMLLENSGFLDPKVESFTSSRITEWSRFGLDMNENHTEYKPGSLYMEAVK